MAGCKPPPCRKIEFFFFFFFGQTWFKSCCCSLSAFRRLVPREDISWGETCVIRWALSDFSFGCAHTAFPGSQKPTVGVWGPPEDHNPPVGVLSGPMSCSHFPFLFFFFSHAICVLNRFQPAARTWSDFFFWSVKITGYNYKLGDVTSPRTSRRSPSAPAVGKIQTGAAQSSQGWLPAEPVAMRNVIHVKWQCGHSLFIGAGIRSQITRSCQEANPTALWPRLFKPKKKKQNTKFIWNSACCEDGKVPQRTHGHLLLISCNLLSFVFF